MNNRTILIGGGIILLVVAAIIVLTPSILPGTGTGGRDTPDNPNDQNPPGETPDGTENGDGGTDTPGGETYTPVYSFEQLKTGNIDKIISCAGPLFNEEEFDGYKKAMGEYAPAMVRFNVGMEDSPRNTIDERMDLIKKQINEKYTSELPFISITYTITSHNTEAYGLDKEVVEGKLDEKIRTIAKGVKSFGRPTFVRIASEFNGNWNNYHKEYFADSYRHIVDIFHEENVDNAIFMWNFESLPTNFAYLEWYPGDEYVDWWSMDVFSLQFNNAKANANMIQFIQDAKARGKPIIIPESAPDTQDMEDIATWNKWFVPYFELVNNPAYPIKGFCYSNRDFGKNDVNLKAWGNMRVDQSETLLPLYKAEVSKETYFHLP